MSKSLSPVLLDWCQGNAVNDIGKVRTHNEDAYLLESWPDQSAMLAVVADGIGGNRSGEIASQIAVDTFAELLEQPLPKDVSEQHELLLKQCYEADRRIREQACQSFKTLGMGTTIVAAIITPTTYIHVYAGDSRFYHFRQGKLQYQTADHTLVQVLVEIGRIKPEDIPTHPMRSVLNSCLGGKNAEGNFSIDPKWQADNPPVIDVQSGDLFLLCSDGLTNWVSKEEIEEIVANYPNDPSNLNQELLQSVLNQKADDNITILTISV